MDWGSIIIGIILFIIIFILPFVLINRSGKKREKRLSQSLTNLAKSHNCQISQQDFWSDSAIGLDEAARMLFFYRHTGEGESFQQVKLSDMQKCHLISSSRNVGKGSNQHKVIDKLELSFLPLAKGRPDIHLEFFNAETDIQLNRELQLIEKWAKRINERLK